MSPDFRVFYEEEAKWKRFWGSRREVVLAENILTHLSQKSSTLEVGCGDGFLSHLMAKRGLSVVGVDISSFRAKYAHKKCLDADFICADGRYLPFISEVFNFVICSEVFEHVPDYTSIIDETYRVIKKKGALLVTVPYREQLSLVQCPHCLKKFYQAGHIHSFDEEKIMCDLKKSGFIIKTMYGFGFDLEGIGKRFPSRLRLFLNKVIYTVFKRASFILTIGIK